MEGPSPAATTNADPKTKTTAAAGDRTAVGIMRWRLPGGQPRYASTSPGEARMASLESSATTSPLAST